MRLNIGCGLVYKKGYINIDAFDNTVADRMMEAHRLDFGDCIAEAVECSHVMEHLGLTEGIYALAEFFRVLKPEGTLLIRTPDVEASFESFLKSQTDKRKYLLNWIYGVDRAGMNHKYGYPVDLLEMLLTDAGFTDIKVKRRGKGTIQPEAAIVCRKPKSAGPAQLISVLRRSLVDGGIVDVRDQVTTMDHESLISAVVTSIKQSGIVDPATLIDIAVQSPPLAQALVKHLHDVGNLKESDCAGLMPCVSELEHVGFVDVLVHMLKEMPLTLPQLQAYDTVKRLGQVAVRNALGGSDSQLTMETVRQTRRDITDPEGILLFTEQALKSQSLIWLGRGIKAFSVSQLDTASNFLERALRLDRDNLLAAWNLARVSSCMGNAERALEFLTYCESLERSAVGMRSKSVLDRINRDKHCLHLRELNELDEPVYIAY